MPSDEDGSFDDLLDSSPSREELDALALLNDTGTPPETPAQIRIRELEAQLAEMAEAAAKVVEKTPEQKTAEHRAAVAATAAVFAAPEAFEQVADGDDVITLHILDSGFTFGDRVWNYGQTVQFKRDGRAYKDTIDRNGDTWLSDLSPQAQIKRFGKIKVGLGPWPGPEFTDELAKQDARRGTAAPIININ